ncbi:MAG: nucleotidyl transferase AbiEii/AbiGii toxin family protein [Candidatus Nanopelagicales bacterium]
MTAWSTRAPWPSPAQVEQDLLLSRVLLEMYQDEYLSNGLVFRGGTCLHKLHLPTPRRYSEDLDFVRTTSSGIAPLTTAVTALGKRLGFDVSTRISQHPKIYLRTTAADGSTLRIKVEINTRERSPAQPLISMPHVVHSPWWSGQGDILTFTLAELVSTKIRALFQRKKGRDLFDLWLALTELNLDPDDILDAYPTYAPSGLTAERAIADLQAKVLDPTFRTDIAPLIDPWPRDYDIDTAGQLVTDLLLSRIPRS